jgi:hypothetical protein
MYKVRVIAAGIAALAGAALVIAPLNATSSLASHHSKTHTSHHHHKPKPTSTPAPSHTPDPTAGSAQTPGPTTAPTASQTASSTPSSTAAPPPPPPPPSGPSLGDLAGFFGAQFDSGRAFCQFSHQVGSISGGVLTVDYPKGSSAQSAGAPYGGAQVCEPFAAGPQTSATLTYKVRFPAGFDWVKGGKLPGLYGGTEPFSGGAHNANGWSLRLMWRAGGAGEGYAYIAGVTGYGLDIGRGNFSWPADGAWHTVSERVVLNSPGQLNGQLVLSLDGSVVINASGLDITETNTPIGGLFFSTFYGGHDSTWAPSQDQHADFACFSMTAG